MFTGICISALSKRYEKLRPPMFAAPVAGASVCTGRYSPQKDSNNELIVWKKMDPLVVPVTGVKFKLAFLYA